MPSAGWPRSRSRIAATPGFAKMASIEAAAPDDDLRPAPGSPALGTAVELPATLPDSAVVTSADAGALPANAPPLRVGVDGAHAY